MVRLSFLANNNPPQKKGYDIERAAANFLINQHRFRLIERNYRCKTGEIDLIMMDQQTWVFVEVRLRNHPNYADGASSITTAKQHKLFKTALHYLQKHKLYNQVTTRFDVVSATKVGDQLQFDWIPNAFTYN